MFRSRTLFIVGAGASCEANLPSGATLTKRIAKLLDIEYDSVGEQSSGDREIAQLLRRHAATMQQDFNTLRRAACQISAGMPQAMSIDNYIDGHRGNSGIETCGKLAIVKSILQAERESTLYYAGGRLDQINFGRLDNTWYNLFIQLLVEGMDVGDTENIFNNVAVITFNYDRCIEYFLSHALANYYAIPAEQAQALVDRLRVVHPYGVVGRLPWQSGSGTQVEFGEDSKRVDLLEIASQIKTFTQRVEDEQALGQIRLRVQRAQRIVFLGFAFHRQNMELLKPEQPCDAKRVFATTKGISESDCEVVDKQIRKLVGKSLRIDLPRGTICSELFKEYWRSLTD